MKYVFSYLTLLKRNFHVFQDFGKGNCERGISKEIGLKFHLPLSSQTGGEPYKDQKVNVLFHVSRVYNFSTFLDKCLVQAQRAESEKQPIALFLFKDEALTGSRPVFTGFSVILYPKNDQIIHGH